MSMVRGRLVAIYNAPFDLRMIEQSHRAHGLAGRPRVDARCLMELYARFRGDWSGRRGGYRWHRLEDAGWQCGIEQKQAHRARADAWLASAVLLLFSYSFADLGNPLLLGGDYPVLATWLYQARFVCGLVTGWLVATTITYAATPAVPPQIQRLGSGSVVVGDSEKIDAVIFLLMTLGVIFVMNWAPALAKLM